MPYQGGKMNLNLRPANECKFDAVSLGEVMLRLDPGEGRIRTARSFRAWEGGGEYNVVRGLRRCFGMKTAVITAFADNEVGKLMEDFILQGGVDTSLIKWMKTDGIGRICRNGLNFTERGFGIRGAVGCSDRANTAISKATPEDFDFDYIFGELGVRWLHTGGIYAALSEQSCETVLAAIKTAKKYGTVISYDLNYRPSMWSAIGGQAKAQEVNKEIAKYVDVMIGNEEDFTACLGFEIEGNDENLKELNLDGYKKMINEAAKTYPNFKAVATTLREVKTATVNDWSAICWADGEIYKAKGLQGTGDHGPCRRRRFLRIRSCIWPDDYRRCRAGSKLRRSARCTGDDHTGRHHDGKQEGSRSDHGRRRRTCTEIKILFPRGIGQMPCPKGLALAGCRKHGAWLIARGYKKRRMLLYAQTPPDCF